MASRQWYVAALISVLLGLSSSQPARAQNTPAYPRELATASARQQQRQQQERQIRPESYDLRSNPVTDANEGYWRNLLWTTAVVEPQEPYVAEALSGILSLALRPVSAGQARTVTAALRVANQLYQKDPQTYAPVGAQLRQIINWSPKSDWVALALSALADAPCQDAFCNPAALAATARQRFPNWANDLALQTTLRDLDQQIRPQPLPPLADLLAYQIAPGELQLYVLCRPNRAVACTTLLKDRTGQFVRDNNNQLWSVPLLTRSLHDLRWNFTRGNTPLGIHRIESTVERTDPKFFRAFGQFPLVQLFVPFENGVKAFLPGQPGAFTGSLQAYTALLPPSWRNYSPIQQSYWAGRLGRSLFRIHGTGDAPSFFSGSQRNLDTRDWSLAIGCLSVRELYDETGALQQADMPRILNALAQAGGTNFTGYLIAVELPDAGSSNQPVSLNDLATVVAHVENQRNPVSFVK
ncbi:hypothetical protein [Leptolyngbya sp. FACHB-261]|uniref:hypothetical protein n=1 Tax=Leptolyngbya sp. FACHB-261 TaxID=2692806 RepID=UPI001684680C|nr:hypothetical protein [Leptolyngbya sp. FACHB-261]MBD2102081.1 hypothetical protein [Leptolyngbya sp. FACHB-261]